MGCFFRFGFPGKPAKGKVSNPKILGSTRTRGPCGPGSSTRSPGGLGGPALGEELRVKIQILEAILQVSIEQTSAGFGHIEQTNQVGCGSVWMDEIIQPLDM